MQVQKPNQPPGAPSPETLLSGTRPRPQDAAQPPAVLSQAPSPVALLRCLWRRYLMALGLGVLLAGLAAPLAWLFAPAPKHQVRTLIQVPPGAPSIVPIASEKIHDLGSHQRNQVALGKSRLVLGSALRDPEVVNLPLIADQLEPISWLEKEIQ